MTANSQPVTEAGRPERDRMFDKYAGTTGPWKNVRADVLALIAENDRLDAVLERLIEAGERFHRGEYLSGPAFDAALAEARAALAESPDEVGPRGCRRYARDGVILCKLHRDLADCTPRSDEPEIAAIRERDAMWDENLDLRLDVKTPAQDSARLAMRDRRILLAALSHPVEADLGAAAMRRYWKRRRDQVSQNLPIPPDE